MNDDIHDFLDNISQEELEQWQPQELLPMQYDVQKRIQKMVKKKMYKNKKWIATAAAFCLFAIIAATTEPVQAALEKIFHFIPNIGVVESDVVYEVEVLCEKLQKDNVTVELKDCYAKYGCLYGAILITDTSPYDHHTQTDDDIIKQDEMMKELYQKYRVTLHHAKQQKILPITKGGYGVSENERQIRKNLEVILDESNEDKYYEIEIAGFEQKLSFCLKEAKQISDLKQIGTTITQNGSSIAATAEMTEQGVKVDYYAICSEEAKTVNQFGERGNFYIMPYFESIPNAVYECYLKTKSGDIVPPIKRKSFKENGGEAIFDVIEKGTATFYYTSLSAKTDEYQEYDMPVPEIGQTIPLHDSIPFEYGNIELISVSHKKSMEQTGQLIKDQKTDDMIQEMEEMDTFIIKVHIQPNQKQKILYHISIDTPLEQRRSKSMDMEENDIFTQTFEINIHHFENEKIKIKFYEPVYWIVGEYAIPVTIK